MIAIAKKKIYKREYEFFKNLLLMKSILFPVRSSRDDV